MNYTITPELLSQYNHYLAKSGYSKATYQKYRGDLAQFCEYQKGKTIDEGLCEMYRQYLLDHYTLRGACSKIVAVNTFFKFAGWDLQMATPRVDRSRVVDAGKEMTVLEYKRLLRAAKRMIICACIISCRFWRRLRSMSANTGMLRWKRSEMDTLRFRGETIGRSW